MADEPTTVERIRRGVGAAKLAADPMFRMLMQEVDERTVSAWRNLVGRGDFQIRTREELHAKLSGFDEIRSVLEGWQIDGEMARRQRDGLTDEEGEA